MARLRPDFASGKLASGSITATQTTLTSAQFANLPGVAAPDTLLLVLDPYGIYGAPERCTITTHTSAATTVQVGRGTDGSLTGLPTRAHNQSGVQEDWIVSITDQDFLHANLSGLSSDDHFIYAKVDGTRPPSASLTGTAGRYIGETNGTPTGGPWNTNDFANDPTNNCFWQCTLGGSPGNWVPVGGNFYVRAHRNGPFSSSSSAYLPIAAVFDGVDASHFPASGGGYNSATGVFTCPWAGRYGVRSSVTFSSSAAGQSAGLLLIKNNNTTAVSSTASGTSTASGIYLCPLLEDSISCAAGDTLAVYTYATAPSLPGVLSFSFNGGFVGNGWTRHAINYLGPS